MGMGMAELTGSLNPYSKDYRLESPFRPVISSVRREFYLIPGKKRKGVYDVWSHGRIRVTLVDSSPQSVLCLQTTFSIIITR